MKSKKIILYIVIAITVLIAIIPMKLCPIWNGEIPQHRNQYEEMTDAIMDFHLYLNERVDESLWKLDNPYSPEERTKAHAAFEWDHAYYNGCYYMYFGIVPVFLTFLPYRIITGHNLITFQSTQILISFYILGLFLLFKLLTKVFFKKMPFSMYLFLSASFSLISVWYITSAPALYCTAIASGICLGVWSLYFFIKSVFDSENEKEELIYLALGSLSGALIFGSRPPIGLFNIVIIPILILLFKKRKINKKRIFKIIVSLLPYVIIGAMLMIYNYLRFDNPFEFGQSYQLTVTDQHNFSLIKSFNFINVLKGLYYINFEIFGKTLVNRGVFITFPILFISLIALFNKKVRKELKDDKLFSLLIYLFISVILIIIAITCYSPYVIPRYRMDILWVLSIITFIFIGLLYNNVKHKKVFKYIIIFLSIIMIAVAVLLFFTPYDANYAEFVLKL